jgi:hypothetical protein
MSKTISPFLIILTMSHMMESVSSVASIFITWDVIWILVTTTFSPTYTWLEQCIYICTNRWDGRVSKLMDHKCSSTLGFFNIPSFLVEIAGRLKQLMMSCLIPQFNRTGVILLASGTLNYQTSRSLSKSLRQLLPRQRRQKACWYLLTCHLF